MGPAVQTNWPPASTAEQPSHAIEVAQGQRCVSAAPEVELVATLGSCVAVCLFSEDRKIGGMNHIFQNVASGELGGGAVIAEVEQLVNDLMHNGVARSELAARVTGGAQVLLRGKQHGLAIADVCLRYLEQEKIPLFGASIGGKKGRRVRFHPASGRLIVGFLSDKILPEVEMRSKPGNEPELF